MLDDEAMTSGVMTRYGGSYFFFSWRMVEEDAVDEEEETKSDAKAMTNDSSSDDEDIKLAPGPASGKSHFSSSVVPVAATKYQLLCKSSRPHSSEHDVFSFDQWDVSIANTLLPRDENYWLDVERPSVGDMRMFVKALKKIFFLLTPPTTHATFPPFFNSCSALVKERHQTRSTQTTSTLSSTTITRSFACA